MIPEKVAEKIRKWVVREENSQVYQVVLSFRKAEEKADILYFLINFPCNFKLVSAISKLEKQVREKDEAEVKFLPWPISREGMANYKFKEMIYDKA